MSDSSMSGWLQTEIKAELEIEEEFCAVVESIKSEEERRVDIKPATLPDFHQLQRVETRTEYSESTLPTNVVLLSSMRCRLCAIPNNDMVEIFSSLEMTKDILEKIGYALPITVKETDTLPKQICKLCLEQLERCYRFCKTVAEAEKQLLVFDKLASMKSEETERNDDSPPLYNAQQGSTESDNVDGPSETNSDMGMNSDKLTVIHKDAPPLRSRSVVLSIHNTRSKNNSGPENGGKSSSNTEDRNTNVKIVSQNHQASTCNPEVNLRIKMEDPDDFAMAESRERLHKCNICAKTFIQKCHLTQHRVVHTNQRPHKCDVCAKTFNQKSNLNQHSLIHTDERLWPHKCHVCEKKFIHKSSLTQHRVVHTGERPHKCEVCAKTFKQKSYLSEHSLIHTDERLWPHTCEVCDKKFIHKSSLTQHRVVHTDERPHKCDVCAKTFKQKSHLSEHSLIHIDERVHKCNVCAKTFLHKSKLTQHSKRHKERISQQ